MARTRTTKAVAQRIDLNYFKRATPFKRAKLWLAVWAPAIALVWIGWHFFAGDARVYSSGRLHAAHAVLEKQCATCHVRKAGGFSAAAEDSACLVCHDGPAHHPEVTASSAPRPACAECHTEHRGNVRLTIASTRNCAECHADLSVAGAGSHFVKSIRGFADGHPEFAALRARDGAPAQDPGTIKLNHALHLKAIRRGPNGPTVQLECSDCHRPSASSDSHWEYRDESYATAIATYTGREEFEPNSSQGLPAKRPWSDRQLMAPPIFANTCAGCHLLTFDKRFDEGAPHDRPDVVHSFLVRKFSEYIASHLAELREVQEPRRTLAGRGAGAQERTASPAHWVAERVAVAEELLWHKTCAQCHATSGAPLQDVKIARWDAAGGRHTGGGSSGSVTILSETKLPRIGAARTKLQWLPHARFDHDAHTGFSCTGCHANALNSTESSDVLIPGIAVCQTCHADGSGHASSECAQCHTYHDWSKRKEVKPVFTLPALRGGSSG